MTRRSLLDSARGANAVRAGARVEVPPVFGLSIIDTSGVTPIVIDVAPVPIQQSIDLSTPAADGQTVYVAIGWPVDDMANKVPAFDNANPGAWPSNTIDQPTPDLIARVRWGAGGAVNVIELDVTTGNGVTLPSSEVTVDVYSFEQPIPGRAPAPRAYTVTASASPGAGPVAARRTIPVLAPLFIELTGVPDPPFEPLPFPWQNVGFDLQQLFFAAIPPRPPIPPPPPPPNGGGGGV